MIAPQIPTDESVRLDTLQDTSILDTPGEERFDRFTRLACQYFKVPIALITLVDEKRVWYKSTVGIDEATESPRNISFCGHTILENDILVVEDALLDERFADNPLVSFPSNTRFYAGAPLRAANGQKLGTLCIIDHKPGELKPEDFKFLRTLADAIEEELAISRTIYAAREIQIQNKFLSSMLEASPDGILWVDTVNDKIKYMNHVLKDFLSIPAHSPSTLEWQTLIDHALTVFKDPEILLEDFKRLRTGTIQSEKNVILITNDDRVLMRISKSHFDCSGGDLGRIYFFQDITENYKSQEKLKIAQEIAKLGYWHWNPLTDKVFWSKQVFKIFDKDPEIFEVNFNTYMDCVHPDDILYLKKTIRMAMQTGAPYSIEHRILGPGFLKWIHGRGQIKKNKAGQIILLHGTLQDITEQKTTEHKLNSIMEAVEKKCACIGD